MGLVIGNTDSEPFIENSDFFFKRFYLVIHKRHTHTQRQRHRQREKQAPCREPDTGLNPGTPGSCPEQRQALNC